MSKLHWDTNSIPNLSPRYLREVLAKLKGPESLVRLGTTGTGQAPHYQVTLVRGGPSYSYSGLTHEPFHSHELFDEGNLSSESFGNEQIENALAIARANAQR
jgi:hypothetical protein